MACGGGVEWQPEVSALLHTIAAATRARDATDLPRGELRCTTASVTTLPLRGKRHLPSRSGACGHQAMRIDYAHMAPTAARPRKTATNLSLRSDLVRRAKALDLNLSEVVEAALAQAIADAERAAWLAANRDAIAAYNDEVAKRGVFSDDWRRF